MGESPNFWESLPIFGRDALSHLLTCDIFQDINVPSLEYLAPVRSIIYYRRNYNTSSEIWENKKYFGRGFWDNWESGFGIIGRFQKKVVGSLTELPPPLLMSLPMTKQGFITYYKAQCLLQGSSLLNAVLGSLKRAAACYPQPQEAVSHDSS